MIMTREDFKRKLYISRATVLGRGHTWDVADVMEVVDEFAEFESEECNDGGVRLGNEHDEELD